MKNLLLIALSICFFTLQPAWGDIIPTKGTWEERGLRSLPSIPTPTPPIVSIEGDVLSLYFSDAISGLTVTVTDASGSVVYQGSLSSSAGSTYYILLGASPGTYQLTLAHRLYGMLVGMFNV